MWWLLYGGGGGCDGTVVKVNVDLRERRRDGGTGWEGHVIAFQMTHLEVVLLYLMLLYYEVTLPDIIPLRPNLGVTAASEVRSFEAEDE
ncbi:hypothetical protein Tco_0722039 [Tanacetum coccineum]